LKAQHLGLEVADFLIRLAEQFLRVLLRLLRLLLHRHNLRIGACLVLRRHPALEPIGQVVGAGEVGIARPVVADDRKRLGVLRHDLGEGVGGFLALRAVGWADVRFHVV